MTVTLEIPDEIARRLASDDVVLARAALEALAAEGVRSGRLTPFQARGLLGIDSRVEMDGILKSHGVLLDITVRDVRRDAEIALAVRR